MVHRLLLFLRATSMTDQHAQLRHTVAQIDTSLAVVRPCIVFTQSNSSVTSNWLLTSRKLETFAFDAQLDLFSDKDRRTIHYLAYYSVTCQNDTRHFSKTSF